MPRIETSGEKLIRMAMPMVRREAAAQASTIPARLRFNDLESELISFGDHRLSELVPTYDASRGSFVTYARPNVRWGMLRYAYRGHVPAHVRMAHLQFHREVRTRAAEIDMHETPAVATEKAINWARQELAGLNAQWAFETLPPDEQLESRQMRARARAIVERVKTEELSEVQRWFMERYYERGEKFVAIAQSLGCDEKTVRRMRDRIQEILERRLRAGGVDGAPETHE